MRNEICVHRGVTGRVLQLILVKQTRESIITATEDLNGR